MPYITQERRKDIVLSDASPRNPGELNYIITWHLTGYLLKQGKSYQTINDILGALEGAKLEFYRRVAVPYENDKRNINSDVYP